MEYRLKFFLLLDLLYYRYFTGDINNGLFIVLVFGVIINGGTFLFMLYNKNIKQLSTVECIKYLVAEDFLSSLVCLIQCILNYHHGELHGELNGCIIEAWQVGFFITITGYSLALISYFLRINITVAVNSKKFLRKRKILVFKFHLIFWIVGALFTTGSTYWPGTSRLNSSGTYCIAAFEKPWAAFFFFGVAVFPTVIFLIVQYLWIFIHVYTSKKELSSGMIKSREDSPSAVSSRRANDISNSESSNPKVNAVDDDNDESSSTDNYEKAVHLKLARKLGSLVLVYFVCYLPFLGSAIYEWSTGYYAPPFVDFTGVLVHIASVANPVMYLWTSNQAKREFWKFIKKISNKEKNVGSL